jgi:hypothetical protein
MVTTRVSSRKNLERLQNRTKWLGKPQIGYRRSYKMFNLLRPFHRTYQINHKNKNLPKRSKPIPLHSAKFSTSSQLSEGFNFRGDATILVTKQSTELQEDHDQVHEHLIARGHSLNNLNHLLMNAAATLDNPCQRETHNHNKNNLYIHWECHPLGIQRNDIREIYGKTLEPVLDYDKMTVAIACPENLRDALTKTALPDSSSKDVTHLLKVQLNDANNSSETV